MGSAPWAQFSDASGTNEIVTCRISCRRKEPGKIDAVSHLLSACCV